MVETDPEIPLHTMMPKAPIIQLLADNEKLMSINKNILRSDADYVVFAEARDGIALDTVIKIASKGTRRLKITFHTKSPVDFPYDVAAEIIKQLGGDIHFVARKVADSFDYIFHFIQLKNKSQKRLKSIYELSYDYAAQEICMMEICTYNYQEDAWTWTARVGADKERTGREEDPEVFERFLRNLKELENG